MYRPPFIWDTTMIMVYDWLKIAHNQSRVSYNLTYQT